MGPCPVRTIRHRCMWSLAYLGKDIDGDVRGKIVIRVKENVVINASYHRLLHGEGAAKVSHFEINCRVLNIIPTVNLFRVFYVPSYNSGWMSFSKRPGKNTPQCYTKPLDSLKIWNNRFFLGDEKVFPTVVSWRTAATKDDKPQANTYSVVDVATLDTHPTASRVIQMVDATELSTSLGTPSTVERSPLDFSNEDAPSLLTQGIDARVHGSAAAEQEIPVTDDAWATGGYCGTNLEKEVISMGMSFGRDAQRGCGGKSLAEMSVDTELAIHAQETQEPLVATQIVNDPDPLSYAKPRSQQDVTQPVLGLVFPLEYSLIQALANPDSQNRLASRLSPFLSSRQRQPLLGRRISILLALPLALVPPTWGVLIYAVQLF
ncbi:hypothetical protein Tco_0673140 [Tanacetum coccineum]